MTSAADIEWRVAPGLTDYAAAVAAMEARVEAIRSGAAREMIWLVEHPPVYTAGTSARPEDLIDPDRFPVHRAGRGGQYTYHGPGQRVIYVMLDLERRGRDVRCFVACLEKWLIAALGICGVTGFVVPGRVGVWVGAGESEAKIAAIGVRVRRWVTYHGAAINIDPDLDHFAGIIPCGIADHGVTSLSGEARPERMADIDAALSTLLPDFLGCLAGQSKHSPRPGAPN
ncbi:MAG: lipoyl(octanoyl) transferase LipB [Polymorphobacter sp.]